MSADGISSLAKGCCATPEWTGERFFVLFPGGSLTDDTKDKLRRYNVNFREAKKKYETGDCIRGRDTG